MPKLITFDEHVERLALYKRGMSDKEIGIATDTGRDSIRYWRVVNKLPSNFKAGGARDESVFCPDVPCRRNPEMRRIDP